MSESDIPFSAAAVAAPIRRLWVLRLPERPILEHSACSFFLNQAADMGAPFCLTKRGTESQVTGLTLQNHASHLTGQG